jgi:hypothetical protein
MCSHSLLLAATAVGMILPRVTLKLVKCAQYRAHLSSSLPPHLHPPTLFTPPTCNCTQVQALPSLGHRSRSNVFPLTRSLNPPRRLQLHLHPLHHLSPPPGVPSSFAISRPLRHRGSATADFLGPLQQVPPCERRSRARLAHLSTGMG